jgi:hypothetical protein
MFFLTMRGNHSAGIIFTNAVVFASHQCLVKMPITIEGTINNTPEAHKVQMHGVVLLLQIHPLIPSP